MSDKILFSGSEYTQESLEHLSKGELTELRNLVAENLGAPRIRNFQNTENARKGAWQALSEYQKSVDNENHEVNLAGRSGEVKTKTARDSGVKLCEQPETIKRLTNEMFFRIQKIGTPESSQRAKFWDDYQEGMRLIDVMRAEGLDSGKVRFWIAQKPPLMELVSPGEEVIAKEKEEWLSENSLETA